MELAGGENILRRNQVVKVDGDQASYKEKQVQVKKMKAMWFLISANQKRYSLLLKNMGNIENVGRYEYPVTTTLAFDILICTLGGIQGNHKFSTYGNYKDRGGLQHKEGM